MNGVVFFVLAAAVADNAHAVVLTAAIIVAATAADIGILRTAIAATVATAKAVTAEQEPNDDNEPEIVVTHIFHPHLQYMKAGVCLLQ